MSRQLPAPKPHRKEGAGRAGNPGEGQVRRDVLVLVCGLLIGAPVCGMQPQASSPVAELAGKARALELRGRSELARQAWEQVLLQDPQNADALKGMVRASQATGRTSEADIYLGRLRAAHPDEPGPAQPVQQETGRDREQEIREAERLERGGKYAEALAIYRKLYGSNPPPGEVALRYYAAQGATEEGRPAAIASLRALADRFPQDRRYGRALGSLLVLNARTEQEGQKLLGGSPGRKPSNALAALPAEKPGAGSPEHAPDTFISARNPPRAPAALVLARTASEPPPDPAPAKAAAPVGEARRGLAKPPAPAAASIVSAFAAQANAEEDRAGYAALNSGRLREAEVRFKVVLARDPDDGRALGGLGLLRLRQGERADGVLLLEQARQKGVHDPALLRGLQQANLSTGAARARVGSMRPLEGLSLPKAAPAAVRNEAPGPKVEAATGAEAPHPPSPWPAAEQTPIPAIARGSAPAAGNELQRAEALSTRGEKEQAAQLYRQRLSAAPDDVAAWSGLITLRHGQNKDEEALQLLDRMPPGVVQTALKEPEFALTAALVQKGQGRSAAARHMLASVLAGAPQPPGAAYGPVQFQLAASLLEEGKSAQAYAMFRAAIGNGEFENAQAWAGLLASLHGSGHDREALAQAESAPATVRLQMESDPVFLETAAMVYAGENDRPHALSYWSRLQQYAADTHMTVRAESSVAFALWLSGTGDETHLYPLLMTLGGRTDLSDAQRRELQRIWAGWAARQAGEQARAGEPDRAKLTLGAAASAFSGNPEALRSLARGYAAINQPRIAVAMLRVQDLENATAQDMVLAVGAALAAHDMKAAEAWLRSGLLRYRRDPDLLMLASRYEQETGHKQESAAYLQAALAIAPAANPLPAPGTPASAMKPVGRGEVDGVSTPAPNLATLFARTRATDKARSNALVSESSKRPFLPSFEGSPASPPASQTAHGELGRAPKLADR